MLQLMETEERLYRGKTRGWWGGLEALYRIDGMNGV